MARWMCLMPRSISPNTTARDAPPAPSTSASVASSHPGAQASRLLMKPSTSVLVERSSRPSYHSVLAAPTARARASGIDNSSARSLCGMVTLAPTKPWRRQMQHELGKAFGRHRLDVVAALDAERAQPVMMDQRRARMRRRPSDQACGAGLLGSVVIAFNSDKQRSLSIPPLRCCENNAAQRQAVPAANQIAARLIQR